MRSILFTIPLDGRLDLGALGKFPVFGVGLLLGLWILLGLAIVVLHLLRGGWKDLEIGTGVVWLIVAVAIFKAPDLQSIPVYGYGTMLFLAFLASAGLAAWRIRRDGADGDIAWDVAMWIFVSGIVGARLNYVVAHPDRFFGVDPASGQQRDVGQVLKALVNLPDGGLVFYGGLIFAPLVFWHFCRRGRINPLAFADIAIASVFVGMMFGRLGCFLHGCCFGDTCSLPWAVEFPKGSVPFEALVSRGLLAGDRPHSLPLHPTQLYDALNSFLLVLLTYVYYPYRRRSGDVLAIGWLAYPISRFLIEFLRSDEPAIWRTPFTAAQLVSLGLFASAVAFAFWLRKQPPGLQPLLQTTGQASGYRPKATAKTVDFQSASVARSP